MLTWLLNVTWFYKWLDIFITREIFKGLICYCVLFCPIHLAIEGFGTEFQVKYSDETCNGVKVHSVKLEAISPPSGYPFQLPLVLLHGTGGGLACFYKQYRRLVQRCIVYAIDIPGFGLSSRLRFSGDIEACETQLKEIVEQWRVKMELDKMVLVGHSLGGYISAIYAIKHHERVARLILIDSWGIVPEKEEVNAKSQGLLYNMATLFCDKMKANPLRYFSYLYPSMSEYSQYDSENYEY